METYLGEQASLQSTAEEPTEKEAAQPSEPENKDGLDVESSKEEPTPEGSASSSEPKKLDPEMDCEEYTYEVKVHIGVNMFHGTTLGRAIQM